MTNEIPLESIKDDQPSEQSLLTEYKALGDYNNSIASQYWTMTGIFIGISSALLIGLVYSVVANQELLQTLLKQLRGEQLEIQLFQTIILVVGMLIVLLLSIVRLWLRRVGFLQQINFERMRDIETQLGMWQSWRVHGVDHWDTKTRDFDNEIVDKNRLINYKPQDWWCNWKAGRRYAQSSGLYYDLIFAVLIFLWLYLVFTIFLPPKLPWSLIGALIIGVVDFFIIRFTQVHRKE